MSLSSNMLVLRLKHWRARIHEPLQKFLVDLAETECTGTLADLHYDASPSLSPYIYMCI